MVVQVLPSGEVCSWNARAKAASQLSTTRLTACDAPRSTWIHCGSLKALDQRVPLLPSTAFAGPKLAFSVDELVAGWPWDSRVAAALPGVPAAANSQSE